MGFYTCFVGCFNASEEGIKNDRILYSEIYSISQDEVLISLQRRRSLIYIPLTQDIILISLRRRHSQRRTRANAAYDKDMVKRLEAVEDLPPHEKDRIFHYIDLIIRDNKAKAAYAS